MLVGVDLGNGQVVALGYVNEHDPQAVKRWLKQLSQQLDVSVIATDDLMTYRFVAEQLTSQEIEIDFAGRGLIMKVRLGFSNG